MTVGIRATRSETSQRCALNKWETDNTRDVLQMATETQVKVTNAQDGQLTIAEPSKRRKDSKSRDNRVAPLVMDEETLRLKLEAL